MSVVGSLLAGSFVVCLGLAFTVSDYGFARVLVFAASISAVLWFMARTLTWNEPPATQIAIGCAVGIVTLGGLPWALNYIRRHTAPPAATADAQVIPYKPTLIQITDWSRWLYPDDTHPLRLTLNGINKGPLAIHGLALSMIFRLTDKEGLAVSDESANMDNAIAEMHKVGNRSQNQIQVGEPFGFDSAFAGITKEHLEGVIAGRYRLYVFLVVSYLDEATPHGKVAAREYCLYYSNGINFPTFCLSRNRVVVLDASPEKPN